MRITDQMMMSHYRRDVSDAFASMDLAMRRAYDYRAFEKPSDDPLAAAQTFQVHWESRMAGCYRSNISSLEGVNTSADHILQQMEEQIDTAVQKINSAVTGTSNAENRGDIANELSSIRSSLLSELNSRYADSYLFGGTNAGSAPFTLDTDGNLLYRGLNVDTGLDKNGELPAHTLEELSDEHVYVDIGLGIERSGGEIDGQSAFDSAMPGIRYLGYGTQDIAGEDGSVTQGVPKNIFSLLKEIEDKLNDDSLSGSDLAQELEPYQDALQTAENEFISQKTEIGSRGNFLEETDGYLESLETSLDERDNEVEYVDFQDAVTDFTMQQYCYEAALQVGGKVLQTSLMDYLR